MSLTEKDIDNFIALYKKTYNESISRERALEEASALVALVKLVYKPMTKAEHKKYYKDLPIKQEKASN